MLRSLVISSSSNAVKYSSLFRSLGVDVSYLILDHSKNTNFSPFNDHRMYWNGVMHYLNLEDNQILSHKLNEQKTKFFTDTLKNYFLKDLKPKKTSHILIPDTTNAALQFFEKSDIVDLKYNKQVKSIQLEVQNKGLVSFDHLFVEKTDSSLEFLLQKSDSLVEQNSESDLVWCRYNYKLSAELSQQDFWFLENNNYLSIFDNCFYLQPQSQQLAVWCLIPSHQYLNQQFHNDFQQRVKQKIENRFHFTSLSFEGVSEQNIHLMNSHKLKLKENVRVSGFPCFSFYSNENVTEWFNQFSKDFYKKHNMKTNPVKENL